MRQHLFDAQSPPRPPNLGATLWVKNRFRVLYRIADPLEVYLLAVGIKDSNRLLIGGEEFEL